MAQTKVTRASRAARKQVDRPVKADIERAAERIERASAQQRLQAELASSDDAAETGDPRAEVDDLHEVLKAAAYIFETGEEVPGLKSADAVLREGLRAAIADFELLGALASTGTAPDTRDFFRAESRCRLALKLADYRARFGGAS